MSITLSNIKQNQSIFKKLNQNMSKIIIFFKTDMFTFQGEFWPIIKMKKQLQIWEVTQLHKLSCYESQSTEHTCWIGWDVTHTSFTEMLVQWSVAKWYPHIPPLSSSWISGAAISRYDFLLEDMGGKCIMPQVYKSYRGLASLYRK